MFLKLERPEMGDLAKENFGCKRKMSIFSSILNPSSSCSTFGGRYTSVIRMIKFSMII